MIGRYLLVIVAAVWCVAPASAGGLSKESQNRIEEQFQAPEKSSDRMRLVVAKGGIPACIDTVEKESYVPLGLGKMRAPQASVKTKKRKSQAAVEIRDGEIKVLRTCPYASLLEKGTVMLLEDFDVEDDRAELSLRELEAVLGAPEGFELFSRVEVEFYFDESLLNADDATAALKSIEAWFRPQR